jgi:hypothetical protein
MNNTAKKKQKHPASSGRSTTGGKTTATGTRRARQVAVRQRKPVVRWLGVPRSLWLFGLAVGLIGSAVLFGPWAQPSAQVRTIVDGFRTSSVYVQPGAPPVLDPARLRQVIGDRPIVVAILNRTPLPDSGDDDPREVLCQQIAHQVLDDYIWVYAQDGGGDYKGDDCYGDDFPRPTKPGVSMDDFDIALNVSAQTAAQLRETDTNLTPEIEEFVLTFDATAGEDYGAVPTRGPVPDRLAGQQIALACLGLVAGTCALFALLRLLVVALQRRAAASAALRRRRAAATADLSRVADAVIHARPAGDATEASRQADTAKKYVLALDALEHAHTEAELADAERDITALVGKVTR